MKLKKEDLLLYAVTDRSWLKGNSLASQVERALRGGVTFVQFREKETDGKGILQEVREIRKICQRYQVPFLINDNVELALAADADGVHVGQNDMEAGEVRKRIGSEKILGVSVHSVEEAVLAQQRGADYLGAGAVFSTSTKKDTKGLTYHTLKFICQAVDIPVVAIGGIGKDNICRLSGSGICGVAVVSAIFAQDEIEQAASELKTCALQMMEEQKTCIQH